ncbi:hypothetical protein M422DRAFT_52546 [Sphaerobolus stellatus SS14]|uniref:F-box domain-containing protein n=2 Tax=Sphaerobolus stellatus (strain SS14) TaxID=990650 RepID=A0A0C9UEI8_SPHS4|nr:hypothetical protein M422DRAFT_52546 [Sphaerobolus stellatus SS14]
MADNLSEPMEKPSSVEEDALVLSTAYIPSASEATLIQQRCMARQQEIENIDDLIAELNDRKWLLQRVCDVGKDLLSPIRRLPPELLTEIFMRCMPEITPKMLNVSNRTTRRRLYSSSTYEFSTRNHPNKMRRRLQEVCQRWSNVIDETPALWSRLALDQALENPEVVRDWLEKSKGTLLDIFMRPVRWFDGDREADFQTVLGYLRSELGRCRTLVLDVRGYPGTILSLFPEAVEEDQDQVGQEQAQDANEPILSSTEAPNLQILALEKSEHQQIAQVFGDINAPNLDTLVIKWASILSIRSSSELPL